MSSEDCIIIKRVMSVKAPMVFGVIVTWPKVGSLSDAAPPSVEIQPPADDVAAMLSLAMASPQRAG